MEAKEGDGVCPEEKAGSLAVSNLMEEKLI